MAGKDNSDKKGFSGLSDLVSIINEPNNAVGSKQKTEKKQPATIQGDIQTSSSDSSQQVQIENVLDPKRHRERNGPKWWAVLGIIAVLIVIFGLSKNWESNKKEPKHTPSSQSYNASQSNPTPAVQSPNVLLKKELQYEKPSIGTNKILSIPQIRWCIRESIRVEAMRKVITTNKKVNKFNQMVKNHNSRCGSFRYRRDALQRAKRDVEVYRSQIVSKAIQEAK